jgi:hypothetical protein
MKMHEHDQEIIMALAEGTLDDAAKATAETEVSGCAECTRDLELQRLALSVLAEAPAVYMTATESSQLHASLRKELTGLHTAPTPTRSQFAWSRWLSVAAGTAAVFLVVFMVLPSINTGDNDSAADMTAAAAAETTASPTAERSTVAASEPVGPEALAGADAADDNFAVLEETTESLQATTTAAATETTASDGGAAGYLPLLGFGELTPEIRDDVILALMTDADGLRLRDEMARAATNDAGLCFAQLATDLGVPATHEAIAVGLLAGSDGEERLVVAYVPTDVDDTILVVVTYPGCQVFETLPLLVPPEG